MARAGEADPTAPEGVADVGGDKTPSHRLVNVACARFVLLFPAPPQFQTASFGGIAPIANTGLACLAVGHFQIALESSFLPCQIIGPHGVINLISVACNATWGRFDIGNLETWQGLLHHFYLLPFGDGNFVQAVPRDGVGIGFIFVGLAVFVVKGEPHLPAAGQIQSVGNAAAQLALGEDAHVLQLRDLDEGFDS